MLPHPPYAWAVRETEASYCGLEPFPPQRRLGPVNWASGSQGVLLLPWALFSWQGLSQQAHQASCPQDCSSWDVATLKGVQTLPKFHWDIDVTTEENKGEMLMGTSAPTALGFHRCRAGLALESERVVKGHSRLAGLAETDNRFIRGESPWESRLTKAEASCHDCSALEVSAPSGLPSPPIGKGTGWVTPDTCSTPGFPWGMGSAQLHQR